MSVRYDVVVLGGALAGASTALLLRRRFPELRILIVEKNPAFDWKVGESTVETSGYFLSRVLRIYDHLSREQLTKQGLRFWFHNGGVQGLREASEVGGTQLARLPSFQLDRAKLDEHVLALAVREGAELMRPARVAEVRLPEETNEVDGFVRVERDGESTDVRAGWIVDASGRTAVIARKRGMLHPLDEHPITAVWARYRGVKDMDGPELAGGDAGDPFGGAIAASRRLATNHFNGYGYWIWFIPLQGGETSVGAVWDPRMVRPPDGNSAARLDWFLEGNPLARQVIAGAERVKDDLWSYQQLPYLVDRVAGPGWSLVGDAGGFLDPFYSPGIDQIAFSASWAVELIAQRRTMTTDEFTALLETHNRGYARYLRGLFEAIYRDKYAIMGDYDAMFTAFLLDTSFYYTFVAQPIYRDARRILVPPFYPKYGEVGIAMVRFYQRRLVSIARRKLRLGIYGNRNAGRRPRLIGYDLGLGTFRMMTRGFVRWACMEIENAWSYIARPAPMKTAMPGPRTPEGAEPSRPVIVRAAGATSTREMP